MSLRDQLPRIIACDPRYALDAYAFVLEALHYARLQKLKAQDRAPNKPRPSPSPSPPPRRGPKPRPPRARRTGPAGHVTGQEVCESLRRLALRQFGLMAQAVLSHWGIRSTSDIGEIVYNMIATGDLEKTPEDSRADFDNVFDFATALRPKLILARDDVA
jgi:uncharacterized repeat protein (TIGR04138 family)